MVFLKVQSDVEIDGGLECSEIIESVTIQLVDFFILEVPNFKKKNIFFRLIRQEWGNLDKVSLFSR